MFSESFLSKKYNFKLHCARYQVAICANQRGYWVDDGNPAGCHDMRCIWRSNFFEQFQDYSQVTIIADTAYIGNYYPIHRITPYKKPCNSNLSAEQERFNKLLARDRVRIENFFGALKFRFQCFHVPYRGPLHHHNGCLNLPVRLQTSHYKMVRFQN